MDKQQVKDQLAQLLKHDPDINEIIREKVFAAKRDHESPSVKQLKQEMTDWAKKASKEGSVNWYTLLNSLYGVLRKRLGLKSVAGLSEAQVPEARQVFEQYKALF